MPLSPSKEHFDPTSPTAEDEQPFLPSESHPSTDDLPFERDGRRNITSRSSRVWRYGRILAEVLLVVVVVAQFVHPYIASSVNAGNKEKMAVPEFAPRKYKFVEQPRYLHEEMFKTREDTLHTLHNWIELSSFGRGYVQINNSESIEYLGEPYQISNHGKDEPVYMMSVFHQLHCLSYLVEAYGTASRGDVKVEQEVVHHATHCFDMLRQAIMCNADTSLEGKSDAGPGWGSVHQCKDYDAVLAWANDHTVVRWRDNMPDEAIL